MVSDAWEGMKMIQTKINTYPVIFTKTFSGLEPEILEEVKTVYPGRVLFVDTAPMPGLVKANRSGWPSSARIEATWIGVNVP